jgi:hypothetical protein
LEKPGGFLVGKDIKNFELVRKGQVAARLAVASPVFRMAERVVSLVR